MRNLPATPRYRDSLATPPLLEVRDLAVFMGTNADHRIGLLADIDFDIRTGETVGLLGESGAGKTALALAILRLLPGSHHIEGSIQFKGLSLLTLKEKELQKIRGSQISLVHQDSSVLNPLLRVGEQIIEVLRAHFNWTRQQYRERAMSLLEEVEMRDAERIYVSFPHQLSGGQRQRIALAQALACQPALVIADEPTASLDMGTSIEILGLLAHLRRRLQTSFLLISHDFSVLTDLADRIMIMYAGRIVEQGSRGDVWQEPLHPYTSALLKCSVLQTPNDCDAGRYRMPTILGRPVDLSSTSQCCAFENRCPDRMRICGTRVPEEKHLSDVRKIRCFKFGS